MASKYNPLHYCWICGKEVELENCKTDEHGSAVHKVCYVARNKMETESSGRVTNRGFVNET